MLVLREPWISRYFRFFTLNIGFLLVGVCFSLLPVVFVSGVFIHLLHLSLVCLFWCAGSVRISLAGRVIDFCVGLRCVECRAGTILFGHYFEVNGGTVQIFLFFGSVVAGTVRLKW